MEWKTYENLSAKDFVVAFEEALSRGTEAVHEIMSLYVHARARAAEYEPAGVSLRALSARVRDVFGLSPDEYIRTVQRLGQGSDSRGIERIRAYGIRGSLRVLRAVEGDDGGVKSFFASVGEDASRDQVEVELKKLAAVRREERSRARANGERQGWKARALAAEKTIMERDLELARLKADLARSESVIERLRRELVEAQERRHALAG